MGGPGEAYVESRGIKVSWRPYHTKDKETMDNKCFILCENINIFPYLGARWEGGGA